MDITKYTPPVIENIIDGETLTKATETLSQLNKTLDAITADKELLTKPLNQSLKAIRDKYRPIETLISEHTATIKSNMISYATAQKALQAKQEAQITARVEKGTLKPETAINKLEVISSLTSNTDTESGKVKFRTVHLYKLKDITKVTAQFLQLNDEAVKIYQKENPIKAPEGIEYYTEERPINYRA